MEVPSSRWQRTGKASHPGHAGPRHRAWRSRQRYPWPGGRPTRWQARRACPGRAPRTRPNSRRGTGSVVNQIAVTAEGGSWTSGSPSSTRSRRDRSSRGHAGLPRLVVGGERGRARGAPATGRCETSGSRRTPPASSCTRTPGAQSARDAGGGGFRRVRVEPVVVQVKARTREMDMRTQQHPGGDPVRAPGRGRPRGEPGTSRRPPAGGERAAGGAPTEQVTVIVRLPRSRPTCVGFRGLSARRPAGRGHRGAARRVGDRAGRHPHPSPGPAGTGKGVPPSARSGSSTDSP